jgi:agmatinase
MTLDLDFFDPGYFPGTGTPEAGGENFHNFMKILKILNTKNFVGADIVELAPQLDASNNSSCFAAKVTREVMLALKLD